MHYALGDYILDIAQNAVEAGSGTVSLEYDESETEYAVTVSDDGPGMDGTGVAKALDPFCTQAGKHPGRKVGLGLPFLVQAVEQAGGEFRLTSFPGKGTTVFFRFPRGNPDCPPAEDLPGIFLAVFCLPGAHEFVVTRRARDRGSEYRIARSELVGALGDLGRVSNLVLLREFLESQERE